MSPTLVSNAQLKKRRYSLRDNIAFLSQLNNSGMEELIRRIVCCLIWHLAIAIVVRSAALPNEMTGTSITERSCCWYVSHLQLSTSAAR